MLCASDLLLIEDTVWRIFVSQAQHVLGTVHCWKAKPIHVSAASEVGMDASLALHCPSRARYGAVGDRAVVGLRSIVWPLAWLCHSLSSAQVSQHDPRFFRKIETVSVAEGAELYNFLLL